MSDLTQNEQRLIGAMKNLLKLVNGPPVYLNEIRAIRSLPPHLRESSDPITAAEKLLEELTNANNSV